LMLVGAFLVYLRQCANCPSSQSPKYPKTRDFGWDGSFHVTAWSDSDWVTHTAMIFNYSHFSRVNELILSRFHQLQWWANQAQQNFHYPTRYYSTTRLWGHYPTLPYSKLKKHYSLGPDLWADNFIQKYLNLSLEN
jgi:hypothetical protein